MRRPEPTVTLGEVVPQTTWSRLRFLASTTALSKSFQTFGEAAAKAASIDWPEAMFDDKPINWVY